MADSRWWIALVTFLLARAPRVREKPRIPLSRAPLPSKLNSGATNACVSSRRPTLMLCLNIEGSHSLTLLMGIYGS